MRAGLIVVAAPSPISRLASANDSNQCRFRCSSLNEPLNVLMKLFGGLPGRLKSICTLSWYAHMSSERSRERAAVIGQQETWCAALSHQTIQH